MSLFEFILFSDKKYFFFSTNFFTLLTRFFSPPMARLVRSLAEYRLIHICSGFIFSTKLYVVLRRLRFRQKKNGSVFRGNSTCVKISFFQIFKASWNDFNALYISVYVDTALMNAHIPSILTLTLNCTQTNGFIRFVVLLTSHADETFFLLNLALSLYHSSVPCLCLTVYTIYLHIYIHNANMSM